MSNSYVKAAFAITMSRADASIVRDTETACSIVADAGPDSDLEPAYRGLGSAFRAAFPGTEGKPFAGFFALFDDPVYPMLDCDIEYGLPDAEGMCLVIFTGEQFGVEPVAQILAACKSALPCGFEFSYDCAKFRLGEFGGGAAIVTAAGVTYYNTASIIQQALSLGTPAATAEPDEEDTHVVLAIRDNQHGLSFLGHDGSYGRLATARVFSQHDAGDFVPTAGWGDPEWLSLPLAPAIRSAPEGEPA